ncbi:MAG: hypothetical protein AB1646_22980 [Thermodesulfobacteriota bacterium]
MSVVLCVTALMLLGSCSLLAHSPRIARESSIPVMRPSQGFKVTSDGKIPYQRLRIQPWSEGSRYLWVVSNHDLRRAHDAEMILYFHGMHSKDYYADFAKDLEALAAKRATKPFVFVGFVDTPYSSSAVRGKNRWKSLVPEEGQRPDTLVMVLNRLHSSLGASFPQLKTGKTRIVLTGFSGGGRVLTSVGKWLAASPKEDPYARSFRSRLSKIVYFDCWFDFEDLTTVPALLQRNPSMKIVGTVHMEKPKKVANTLAGKFKMRHAKANNSMVGLGGRLVIFNEKKSHWEAIKSKLSVALGG